MFDSVKGFYINKQKSLMFLGGLINISLVLYKSYINQLLEL